MRSKYIAAGMSALAFGLSVSFWWAASEMERQRQKAHDAQMAQLVAEEKVQVLSDKLVYATRAREFAEASQIIMENAERTALVKARVAENARMAAVAQLASVQEKLDGESSARSAAEASLFIVEHQFRTASAKIHQETAAKEAAELAKFHAEAEATAANVRLALQEKAQETAKLAEKTYQPKALPTRSNGGTARRTEAKDSATVRTSAIKQAAWKTFVSVE